MCVERLCQQAVGFLFWFVLSLIDSPTKDTNESRNYQEMKEDLATLGNSTAR
jgi:hypothetical protein